MTRPMKRKPSLMLLLVVALLALAPLLAALQYRWLGQVSEGERERMKNNLNATAKQFCQDFDGELTAIYMLFQPAFAPFSDPINRVSQAQDDFPQGTSAGGKRPRIRGWSKRFTKRRPERAMAALRSSMPKPVFLKSANGQTACRSCGNFWTRAAPDTNRCG